MSTLPDSANGKYEYSQSPKMVTESVWNDLLMLTPTDVSRSSLPQTALLVPPRTSPMTPSTHLPNQNHSSSVQDEIIDVMVVQAIEVATDSVKTTEAVVVEVDDTIISTQTVTEVTPKNGRISPSPSGALVTSRGSFSTFLAPLTQDTFKQVVTDVENKLKVVNQTLSMLDAQGFDSILEEMLSSITFKTAELLNADRASIFLLDEEKNELYSIVAQGAQGGTLEIRIPADMGIAGEVAMSKMRVNISFDFYDDPRSAFAKKKDRETGYRTYTMVALPLLDEVGGLVAVVQLINKLKPNSDTNPAMPLEQKIDLQGFTPQDEQVFEEFAPSIRLILQSSRSFYLATQKQRAASALMNAIKSLSQSGLDLEDTLKRVMDEAKELMQADRSTLWLVDQEQGQLWTKFLVKGELQEIRIPIDAGFAGQVATTGEPLLIPFDLYDHPNSDTAKKTDQESNYRTCSMLCMPVFNGDNELIGVTQLINKRKQGDHPDYDPANYPVAPECWRASFNRNDLEFMQAFNIQAGVALQNAKLFQTVKQQEQMQRDILRSLSNGVISTDKNGNIIEANESALEILGLYSADLLKGKSVRELIAIDKGDFSKWFDLALQPKEEKNRQQYYPDQTLEAAEQQGAQHSINLSINTIANANNDQEVSGVLVVMEDISDEKRLKSTMYRYMTQELAEQLLENPDAAKMGGDRKEVSVLFSDIRSYTSITEKLTAEEVVEMLNRYFEVMVEAVFDHKGTLDKYIGDAIMAVFGSPLPLVDHPWMAVQTAVEMRQRLIEFNQDWTKHHADPIRIGIGINSDTVISGNIGSSKRMEFTAIGDGVNLGSRLESASKIYGTDIIISETTYEPCKHLLWTRELDYIKVKGKNKPVAVYEVVGLQSEPVADAQKRMIDLYHGGLSFYRDRKFRLALNEFATIVEEIDSKNKAALMHMERCQYYMQSAPPEDWDCSWTLTEK